MIDRKRLYDAVRPLFGGHFTQAQVNGVEAILGQWDTDGPFPSGLDRCLATAFVATGGDMLPADGDLQAFTGRFGPAGDWDAVALPDAGKRGRGRRSDSVEARMEEIAAIAACFLVGLRRPA